MSAAMSGRESLQSQLEHLQMKYVGTGHADTTKYEFAVNQHRDSIASYIGHFSLQSYFSIVENEAVGRIRYNFLQKMIDPCGPAPKVEAHDDDEEEEEEDKE